MKRYNPVGRKGARYEREIIGIGRVIIPTDTSREEYIANSYRTGTVSIISKTNLSVMHEVLVDTSVLGEISFPYNNDKGDPTLGSTVVWVNIPVYNQPVVIAKLNSSDEQTTQLDENEFHFTRSGDSGVVSIFGSAKGSTIDIVSQSNNKGGRMRVSVSNYNNTAKMDIVVNGDYTLSSNTVHLEVRDSILYTVSDKKSSSKDTTFSIENDKIETSIQESTSGFTIEKDFFNIGKGEQSGVRGDDLESFLHTLIDTIASQQVATALGPQPLMNAAGLLQLKSQTSQWLSDYLKVE